MSKKVDAVFVRANLSRDHGKLLQAFEMSEDEREDRPRRPLNDLEISELRGAAIGYWKGWTFLIHPHAAFALVPTSDKLPDPSDTARRLGALAPESFAVWTDEATRSSAFGLLRGGRWARIRSFANGEVGAEAGKPLPFELRSGDLDFRGWPQAASVDLLGVDMMHLLESDILTATVHAPW